MIRSKFNILLVDDEPDVLSVSKLAMQNFKVYGLPLKIHTASSKAEAIELINSTLLPTDMPGHNFAVAFIDVVMETDQAGLELCQYIRETLKNREVQLYIRTGQPGVAPEREVIDRYDINGYFTKMEATEDKLYSLVKSGVRMHHFISSALILNGMTHAMIAASDSRDAMYDILMQVKDGLMLESGLGGGFIFEDRTAFVNSTGEETLELRDELDKLEGITMNAEGDKYVLDGHRLLIKIAASPTTDEVYYLLDAFNPPSELFVLLFYQALRSLAALWKKAG